MLSIGSEGPTALFFRGGSFLFPVLAEPFGKSSASTSAFLKLPDWSAKSGMSMSMLKASSSASPTSFFFLLGWPSVTCREGHAPPPPLRHPTGPWWRSLDECWDCLEVGRDPAVSTWPSGHYIPQSRNGLRPQPSSTWSSPPSPALTTA